MLQNRLSKARAEIEEVNLSYSSDSRSICVRTADIEKGGKFTTKRAKSIPLQIPNFFAFWFSLAACKRSKYLSKTPRF